MKINAQIQILCVDDGLVKDRYGNKYKLLLGKYKDAVIYWFTTSADVYQYVNHIGEYAEVTFEFISDLDECLDKNPNKAIRVYNVKLAKEL